MPAKNIVKNYIAPGYYHIYNRGVEKRNIFLDEQDCQVFQYYLKLYLSPKEEIEKLSLLDKEHFRLRRFLPLNLSEELDLLAFTPMPNHIHLELKQYTENAIVKLMRRITTAYVMYFNNKYQRIGPLFQSSYKARLIDSDYYLLHVSRYIHLNSRGITGNINFHDYSSYPYYLGTKKASWIKPQEVLGYFNHAKSFSLKDYSSYENFVEMYAEDAKKTIGDLMLED